MVKRNVGALPSGGEPISPIFSTEDPDPSLMDQRVLLHGMRWSDYEVMLAVRGERSSPRMYFLEGTIEIMSPGFPHEGIKTTIARLVEAWADEIGLEFNGYGSWTLKEPSVERGAEPDECYVVGATVKERPDFVVEVEWTRGGLDKLKIYAGLGVREVWLWRRAGHIDIYALRDGKYEQIAGSEVLPALDLPLLTSFVLLPSQTQAVRGFREALRSRGKVRRRTSSANNSSASRPRRRRG